MSPKNDDIFSDDNLSPSVTGPLGKKSRKKPFSPTDKRVKERYISEVKN